jgi:small conductance mechanosensitive channel
MGAMDTVTQYAVQYGAQAVVALGMFVVGAMASRWVGNIAWESFDCQTLEPPVRMLLVRVVTIVMVLSAAVIPIPVFPLQSYCNV